MFSAELITFFFIGMFAGVFAFQFFDKRGATTLAKVAVALVCIASIYCVLAGLFLAIGWRDPIATVSANDIAEAVSSPGGRGGIAIFAIRFWPFVLIGLGGYMAYYGIQLMLSMLRKR